MEKQIQHKDYGLIIERWYDGALVVVRGSGDMSRKALDHWLQQMLEAMHSFGEFAPVFILMDLSSPRQGFTPYSRKVIDDLFANIPKNKPVYGGIYMREGIISRIISLYVNRREGKDLRLRMFFSQADTLAWMHKMMIQEGVLDEDDLAQGANR